MELQEQNLPEAAALTLEKMAARLKPVTSLGDARLMDYYGIVSIYDSCNTWTSYCTYAPFCSVSYIWPWPLWIEHDRTVPSMSLVTAYSMALIISGRFGHFPWSTMVCWNPSPGIVVRFAVVGSCVQSRHVTMFTRFSRLVFPRVGTGFFHPGQWYGSPHRTVAIHRAADGPKWDRYCWAGAAAAEPFGGMMAQWHQFHPYPTWESKRIWKADDLNIIICFVSVFFGGHVLPHVLGNLDEHMDVCASWRLGFRAARGLKVQLRKVARLHLKRNPFVPTEWFTVRIVAFLFGGTMSLYNC